MVPRSVLTDQPLRWVAVLLFAPLLVWRGVVHGDPFVILFGVGLGVVDAFCIAFLSSDRVPREAVSRAEQGAFLQEC